MHGASTALLSIFVGCVTFPPHFTGSGMEYSRRLEGFLTIVTIFPRNNDINCRPSSVLRSIGALLDRLANYTSAPVRNTKNISCTRPPPPLPFPPSPSWYCSTCHYVHMVICVCVVVAEKQGQIPASEGRAIVNDSTDWIE